VFDTRPYNQTPFLRLRDGRVVLLSDVFMTSAASGNVCALDELT
jgi:hypothetical protein